MGLQKEIWRKAIVENLYANNAFLGTMKKADQERILNNLLVHVPKAGAPSATVRNRATLPASIVRRTDTSFTYGINSYTIDPTAVSDLETAELSYDKLQSVIDENMASMLEFVGSDIIYNICADLSFETPIDSPGTFTYKDLTNFTEVFSTANVPMVDRYALLTPKQVKNLKEDMGEKNFAQGGVDYTNGVIAKVDGWNIIERSYVLHTSDGISISAPETYSAGDVKMGMFYQKNQLEYALGDVDVYDQKDHPEWYGDVFSVLTRAGSTALRAEGIKVVTE